MLKYITSDSCGRAYLGTIIRTKYYGKQFTRYGVLCWSVKFHSSKSLKQLKYKFILSSDDVSSKETYDISAKLFKQL